MKNTNKQITETDYRNDKLKSFIDFFNKSDMRIFKKPDAPALSFDDVETIIVFPPHPNGLGAMWVFRFSDNGQPRFGVVYDETFSHFAMVHGVEPGKGWMKSGVGYDAKQLQGMLDGSADPHWRDADAKFYVAYQKQ